MRSPFALMVLLGAGLSLAGCLSAPAPSAAVAAAPAPTPPQPPGTIVAGVVGASIGRSLSEENRRRALAAEYQALESGVAGTPLFWRGDRPEIYGEVTPGPRYFVNAYECRDYAHVIVAGGVREAGRGTSCRLSGGPWDPVI